MNSRYLFDLLNEVPLKAQQQAAPNTWECAIAELPDSGNVLVAGAGRGGLSWILNRGGYEVTSVDLHPEHFSIDELDCFFSDLNDQMKFEDNHFDVVLAVEVIEHLENPWTFFREAIRVVRKDGLFIFTTPNIENLMSRVVYLLTGIFPYFRYESFVGCFHVTPIHSWSVERCCLTSSAKIEKISYSRFDFPRKNDIPRHDGGKGLRRKILDFFPLNSHTGEIACFKIRKTNFSNKLEKGIHTK